MRWRSWIEESPEFNRMLFLCDIYSKVITMGIFRDIDEDGRLEVISSVYIDGIMVDLEGFEEDTLTTHWQYMDLPLPAED